MEVVKQSRVDAYMQLKMDCSRMWCDDTTAESSRGIVQRNLTEQGRRRCGARQREYSVMVEMDLVSVDRTLT